MLQLAIISDVHGNLPALDRVLGDIEDRGIQQVFYLGDLVDFAPWPNEVIDRIREKGIPCLLGNHDERIAFDHPVVPLAKHSEEETAARLVAIAHSKTTVTEVNKAFMAQCPFTLQLNYKVGPKHWTIQLVHGSLENNYTYVYENEEEAVLRDFLERSNADVLLMGHTHLSYLKKVDEKWVINTGSVGRSREENRLASYVILTLSEEAITPEIIQLAYPIEEVALAIEKSGIPAYYATYLRGGN